MVESVLECLAAGETIEQLLGTHPRLTRQGILAAIQFAGQETEKTGAKQ